MTLEQNVLKIIDKLNKTTGKLLDVQKRLKKLEEREYLELEKDIKSLEKVADYHTERIKALENKPSLKPEGTGFIPNKKFMGWYLGVFKEETDPELEELKEEFIVDADYDPSPTSELEAINQGDVSPDVSPEILEKLEEIVNGDS